MGTQELDQVEGLAWKELLPELSSLPDFAYFYSSFFSYFFGNFRHFFKLMQYSQREGRQKNFLLAALKLPIPGAFTESFLGKPCKQNLCPG